MFLCTSNGNTSLNGMDYHFDTHIHVCITEPHRFLLKVFINVFKISDKMLGWIQGGAPGMRPP